MNSKLDKIAIVAMAGIFPGADRTDLFLQNILDKKEAIIRVPAHRWICPAALMAGPDLAPDRALSDRAGVITHFDFDPSGFRVDKDLLAGLDPALHLVLAAGRQAVEACYISKSLKPRTGVILAAIALPTDTASRISWEILGAQSPKPFVGADAAKGAVVSAPAAILASAMGFYGGSFTLDAACASSLVAIKLACEHLTLKKADIMVTGGVSRPDSLYTQVGFSQLQALSPTGRCAPFDRKANGLVVGEGTGILVLKRLEDALACQDTIHGIITGAGVSNDLEGSLVGPASEGQIRAMQAAYGQAGWSPADIQYMECHGSGTPVGDQVEAATIRHLLRLHNCPQTKLSIGSIKSMIGHLLTAAGAAGMIKTVLAMEKGVLPPSLNFRALPDNSPLQESSVRIQTDPEPWHPLKPGLSRKAGISAFGFGGINAHVLVEEYRKRSPVHFVPRGPDPDPLPFTLVPCAVVGMETLCANANTLDEFKQLIFGLSQPRYRVPGARWRRTDHLDPETRETLSAFMETVSMDLGEFHIPPLHLEDILPQHLIMLKAAKGALEDAGISPRPLKTEGARIKTGCAVGIEFDFGATDFFLRWKLHDRDHTLVDEISPPLTFQRTLGALGGIVASRIAREFRLGGPCFTLSAGDASGLKAIEIAVHSLSRCETDLFLCGSVDLCGDIRQFTLNHAAGFSQGAPPSEGAGALVLKRLDQAIQDQDRIYGIITGISGSGGAPLSGENRDSDPDDPRTLVHCYADSFNRALNASNTRFSDLSFMATHALGTGVQGQAEDRALGRMAAHSKEQPAFPLHRGSMASTLGNTQGVSSLFSLIGTCLSLFHRVLPAHALPAGPLMAGPPIADSGNKNLSCPASPGPEGLRPWEHLRPGPRRAAVGSITRDGACAHAIVEEYIPQDFSISRPGDGTHSIQTRKPQQIQNQAGKELARQLFTLKTSRRPITPEMIQALHGNHLPGSVPAEGSLADPDRLKESSEITARAHETFLAFSTQTMKQMEIQFAALVQAAIQVTHANPAAPADPMEPPPLFLDRDQCLEFARGKAGNVLGPAFDIIDTYPVRVRLPDEPLMLVDRIMEIQGEMLSMTQGKIITQHDVQANAWYLDGGKTPVSISIEAGQADLFLCAFLGIDHQVKGERKYRLLDAKVTFHRPLASPGETIEYHIEIDRFLKQGEIVLFFFHYQGYIEGRLFISMRDGCAGFFTEQEVKKSGGIILKKTAAPKPAPGPVSPLVPCERTGFSREQIQALRKGDLETAFGSSFNGIRLGKNQWLPGGRMNLIHRVIELDPRGGRFGQGFVCAEADIHPDDWFLTCHFIDDMVMPGTLMYECCAHALRIFVQRMGWVSPDDQVHYDVIPFHESDLKCRGPVTRETRIARYEIHIKQMGYRPEPYVIADAHMFADNLQIVLYQDMGMKLCGITQDDLNHFWRNP